MAGGVYAVTGTAVTPSNIHHTWRVIVKRLCSPAGVVMPNGMRISREMAEDQANFGYWKREALVAQSGLLDELPPGLAAPRCLGLTKISPDEVWLWQEAAADDREWGWDDYREAAYRLGLWQGRFVMKGWERPSPSWLTQNWLSSWVNGPLIPIMGLFESAGGWRHPLVNAHLAPEEIAQLQQLWADRNDLLASLVDLPQALSHLDAYRANLFWQNDTLTLIDWAFTGMAALGEEMAAFVGATLLLGHVPIADAEQLESAALDGYTAGLCDAGWQGDAAQIWQTYRCAMSLRYALASLASIVRTAVDPDFARDWERQTNKPLADILAHRAGLIRFYLSRQPRPQ
jgi:hypothetical protein